MIECQLIAKAKVKINVDGLYCINDLHSASGAELRHQPAQWLRLSQTKELILELEQMPDTMGIPIISKEPGRHGGTYVCEDLVTLYAAWISPRFNIEVSRFFRTHKVVSSGLDLLVDNVRSLGDSIVKQLQHTSLTIDEVKRHGSTWGSYGSTIRKAKKECRVILEDLKDQIQMKLDFD